VTPEILAVLQKMPPHRIGVTLYGACNADYEKICGCKDGFDRAMDGLAQLLTLPSAMEVRMTLIQDNYHQADAIEKLIRERFGLPVIHTSFVYKSVRGGCMHPEECRMTPEQMVDLTYDRAMQELRKKIPEEMRPFLKVKVMEESTCPEGKEHATLMGCSAGMDSYTITWDGKLQGCQMLDAFCVDTREIGFQKAWEQYPATVRIPEPEEECRNCEFAADCQVCPAVAMAETGTLQGSSPYICEFTKLTRKKKEELQL
jgi:radical SAM protein with 4Fe4S-binding SPASM domain